MGQFIIGLMLGGFLLAAIGAVLMVADWWDGNYIAAMGALFLVMALLALGAHQALARDPDGRYARAPLHDWFDSLRSGKGPCCSDADGTAVPDTDWESVNDPAKPNVHYRVHIPDRATPGDPLVWVDVPDNAVLTEPNKDGRTIVWPFQGYGGVQIRCFILGSLS